MPMGGNHKSKSAALKKLEGDRRKVGRAKLDEQIEREPKGRGKPVFPDHLTDAEKREFQRVIMTAPAALLTGADQRLIENYCVASVAAEDARVKLAATGKMVQSKNGPVVNPFWRVWRQASNDARLMGQELGLSPAARSRLAVEPEKSTDPMELLLGPEDWSISRRTRQ